MSHKDKSKGKGKRKGKGKDPKPPKSGKGKRKVKSPSGAALVHRPPAPGTWAAEAYAVVVRLARKSSGFTAQDVWRRLDGDGPQDGRAMGPVLQAAAAAGIIQRTGRLRTVQRGGRDRQVAEWIGR